MVPVVRWPALTLALALAGAALGTVVVRPSIASACGGFFSKRIVQGARRPSLAYERTLIIYNQEVRREQFIREVSFRAAGEPFGFVVPAPSRPTVASIKSPFDSLEQWYSFEDELGLVGSRGGGLGLPPKSRGVTVLEVKRVGSFNAFVLAADDEHALGDWLEKNGFTTTAESAPWLEHYVRMKFFYVAMRYSPPPGKGREGTKAETIRISFDTPVAYYPYFEPDPAPGAPLDQPRMLEMWFVSKTKSVPIAARSAGGETGWVRPMQPGRTFSTNAQARLEEVFGDAFAFLPKGPIFIQTFIDQKRSRVGYGDVLFVPESPATPNIEAMRSLFPVLDPSLLPPKAAEQTP